MRRVITRDFTEYAVIIFCLHRFCFISTGLTILCCNAACRTLMLFSDLQVSLHSTWIHRVELSKWAIQNYYDVSNKEIGTNHFYENFYKIQVSKILSIWTQFRDPFRHARCQICPGREISWVWFFIHLSQIKLFRTHYKV